MDFRATHLPTEGYLNTCATWFQVSVEGAGEYKAVRFAVRNTGQTPPLRGCDTGLSDNRTCTPTWLSHYSPHSFRGIGRPGAWQLIPGKGFLIHEGADSRKGEVAGGLGCIEIVDGGWNSFLADIERLGGASCSLISQTRKLTVKIERVTLPAATIVARSRRAAGAVPEVSGT
jgi:hypothetical protein